MRQCLKSIHLLKSAKAKFGASKFGHHGFSIVEVLVACALTGLVLVVLADATSYSIDLTARETEMASRTVENDELARLLSNSMYLGFLSESPLNLDLAKCANADGIDCDANVSYPLTLISTATNQPMVSATGILDGNATNEVTFKVSCANHQTKCDKAQWFVVTIKTTEKAGLNLRRMVKTRTIEKSVVVAADIQRHQDFIPDNIIAPGRPINVILFVDTSNSMKTHIQKVMAAVSNLVDSLAKLKVDVNILVSGFSSAKYNMDYNLLGWMQQYSLVNGLKVLASTAPGYGTDGFEFFYDSILEPRYLSAVPIKLANSDSLPNRDSIVQAINNEINAQLNLTAYLSLSSGTVGVDFKDICLDFFLGMMAKVIAGQAFGFGVDKQTPTIIYSITNEDDDSDQSVMLEELNYYKIVAKPIIVTPVIQTSGYEMTAWIQGDGVVDGVTGRVIGGAIFRVPLSEAAKLTDLTGSACSADRVRLINLFCSGDSRFQSASGLNSGCSLLSLSPTYQTCFFSTQTYVQGVPCDEVALLAGSIYYIPNSCTTISQASGGLTPQATGTKVITRVYDDPVAHAKNDAVLEVYEKIKSVFGKDNVFYTAVVHPDATTCPMDTGDRVGTKYVRLANMLGDKQSTIIPICSQDYSTGLDKINTFVQTLAQDDFVLPAKVLANMKGVLILKKNGTTVTPTANVNYKVVGTNLIFTKGYIVSDDIVRVYYGN